MSRVLGIGVDLTQMPRMRRVVARWDERFLQRVFTEQEMSELTAKPQSAWGKGCALPTALSILRALRFSAISLIIAILRIEPC